MTNQSLVFVQCKTTLISILVSHNKLHLSLSIHSSFSNEVAQFLFCLAIKKIRAQQVHYSEIKFNWVLWSQPLMITPLLFLFSWPFAHFTSPMQSTPPTPPNNWNQPNGRLFSSEFLWDSQVFCDHPLPWAFPCMSTNQQDMPSDGVSVSLTSQLAKLAS